MAAYAVVNFQVNPLQVGTFFGVFISGILFDIAYMQNVKGTSFMQIALQKIAHLLRSDTSSGGNSCTLSLAIRDKLTYLEQRFMMIVASDLEIVRVSCQTVMEFFEDPEMQGSWFTDAAASAFKPWQEAAQLNLEFAYFTYVYAVLAKF